MDQSYNHLNHQLITDKNGNNVMLGSDDNMNPIYNQFQLQINPSNQQNIQITSNVFQQSNRLRQFEIHPQYQPSHFSSGCKEHVIKILRPVKRRYYQNYSYVICPNITTTWLKSYGGFSYLTSYSNDENNYFFPLTNEGFKLDITWTDQDTKFKVSREKLSQFIYDLNNEFKIPEYIYKAKSKFKIRNLIFLFFAILALILVILQLIFYYSGGWIITIIVALISMVGLFFNYWREYQIELDENLISNTNGVENFLENWNVQYFIPNGLYVMAPRNLKYLQFVFDTNLKLIIQNHKFPFDLRPIVTRSRTASSM